MPAASPVRYPVEVETEKYRIDRQFFDARSGCLAASVADLPGKRSLCPDAVRVFVQMGYVPGIRTLFENVDCLPGGRVVSTASNCWHVERTFRFAGVTRRERYAASTETDLVSLGGQILVQAAGRAFGDGDVLVPLSGGLDSRSLLGALLELTESHNINTYTYGVPGSLDYEIGNAVGRKAGTRHVSMDLRQVRFTKERLIETALETDGNANVFQPYVWTEVMRRFGRDATVWSGYTGDGIGGSFYEPWQGTEQEAVDELVDAECFFCTWEPRERAVIADHFQRDTKFDGVLHALEAIWFENHVERYTTNQIFMRSLRYRAPFMDDAVVQFFLDVQPEHREGKRLFNRLVAERFPALFELPTRDYGYRLAQRPMRHVLWRATTTARKAVHRFARSSMVHPETAYLDLTVGLRERDDLRRTVRELLNDLVRREIVDRREVERLWREHQAGARHTGTLLVLASLEAIAQAFCDA